MPLSEEGLIDMLLHMHRLAERDLSSRNSKHFHSAVLYHGDLGTLEQACRERDVDYDGCTALYDAAEAGKRGR